MRRLTLVCLALEGNLGVSHVSWVFYGVLYAGRVTYRLEYEVLRTS